MAIVTSLAGRFLAGKKRNRFLSFITGVSLFGVAVGVTALVVVMGVMEGFETTLRSIVSGTHSDVVIYSRKSQITDAFAVDQRLRQISPDVEATSAFIFSEVMVAFEGKVAGSLLEGVDERTIASATKIQDHIVRGEFPAAAYRDSEGKILREGGIVLGSAMAERLGASVGDIVSVISPFFENNTLQPRAERFRVSGISSTGMYEYDSKHSFILAQEARLFFRIPENSASAFKIKVKHPDRAREVGETLERELGYPYVARDWSDLNRNLMYAIKLQKAVIFIVLTAIVIVAAFNIMSTLVMMMSEKKREISILKAMGLSRRQSYGVFLMVGSIIGVAGAVGGASLGILAGQILAHTRFINLPADVYFISYLPVDQRPSTLIVVMVVAILVALLASVYPSWRVSRESPIEGLRYE